MLCLLSTQEFCCTSTLCAQLFLRSEHVVTRWSTGRIFYGTTYVLPPLAIPPEALSRPFIHRVVVDFTIATRDFRAPLRRYVSQPGFTPSAASAHQFRAPRPRRAHRRLREHHGGRYAPHLAPSLRRPSVGLVSPHARVNAVVVLSTGLWKPSTTAGA